MGRRKKHGSVALLIEMPWQVSAVIGALAYCLLRWFIPAFFAGNPVLGGLALLSHSTAWIALVVFGVTALAAFARTAAREKIWRVPAREGSKSTAFVSALPAAGRQHHSSAWGHGAGAASARQAVAPADARRDAPAFVDCARKSWSIETLRSLEWKRFELLCARYYEMTGFKSETIRCGPDGGIDIKLFRVDPEKPLAVVQCKAWNSTPVGVKEVRELLGVMTHEKVARGIFITTSTYTQDAQAFGAANPLQLLNGADFVKKLQALPQESSEALLDYAFEGDYLTPTCASCGIKMVHRTGKLGTFWGCMNYPRCKSTFGMKAQ